MDLVRGRSGDPTNGLESWRSRGPGYRRDTTRAAHAEHCGSAADRTCISALFTLWHLLRQVRNAAHRHDTQLCIPICNQGRQQEGWTAPRCGDYVRCIVEELRGGRG